MILSFFAPDFPNNLNQIKFDNSYQKFDIDEKDVFIQLDDIIT